MKKIASINSWNMLLVLIALTAIIFGCSENNVAGGSAEETSIAVNNISVAGNALGLQKAERVKTLRKAAEDEILDDSMEVNVAYSIGFPKDSRVVVFELDSEYKKTGKTFVGTVYDDDGTFKVENVSLKSSYALIAVAPKDVSKDSIWKLFTCDKDRGISCYGGNGEILFAAVDLNESQDVNVNFLTYLSSKRTLALARNGEKFNDAKKEAEELVLNTLGIYEPMMPFEKISLSDVSDAGTFLYAMYHLFGVVNKGNMYPMKDGVYLIGANFLATDLADGVRDGIQGLVNPSGGNAAGYEYSVYNLELRFREHSWREYHYDDRYTSYDWGLRTVDSNFIKELKKYKYNVFATISLGLDACTADKEGEIVEPNIDDANLVCTDGYWVVMAPNYVVGSGTMIDPRDGKKYRTTIFTINGRTEEWMSENLNYENDSIQSWCFGDKLESCSKNGRLYTWMTVMNVNASAVVSKSSFESVQACLQDFYADYMELDSIKEYVSSPCDSSLDEEAFLWCESEKDMYYSAEASCKSDSARLGFNYDVVLDQMSKPAYHDICPDGWHIPSVSEWIELLQVAEPNAPQSTSFSDPLRSVEWKSTVGKYSGSDYWGLNFRKNEIEGERSENDYYAARNVDGNNWNGIYFNWNGGLVRFADTDVEEGMFVRCVKD